MQLRRDPITQSWVNLEDEGEHGADQEESSCPLCPGQVSESAQTLYEYPGGGSSWQVRVTPHLHPIYRIEGDPQRRAEGLYDKMRSLGAHEIVVENPNHDLQLSRLSDENVAQVLRAYLARMNDLKRDRRFRYVTVFRNHGTLAGGEYDHPHSEITATPFIPRRVAYELRAAQAHYRNKERCLFCDIVKQEMDQQVRAVAWNDLYVAFCPFASRVPYETWIMPIYHHASFEDDVTTPEKQYQLGRLLKSTIRRLSSLAKASHMVLHTSPNVRAKPYRADAWRTLTEDYHWHIEILPIISGKSRSYSFKEVYFNSLPTPEAAAKELRDAGTAGRK